MKAALVVATALLTAHLSTLAEDKDQSEEWQFNAQLLLRSEVDARDFSNDSDPLTITNLRTRVGLQKTIGEQLTFFGQIQDSRVLGSEANTLTNTGNLDAHQVWVRISNLFDTPLDLQAGRFEMLYGTQRFIGPVGWHFVGRSFDGARFMYNDAFRADAFAIVLNEANAYIGNANPGAYPIDDVKANQSQTLYGLWTSFDLSKDNKLDVFALLEDNSRESNGRDNDLSRITGGVNYVGTFGKFSTTLEAAYQSGTQGIMTPGEEGEALKLDLAAYLASLTVAYQQGDWTFALAGDLLSGTDPADVRTDNNTFATPFATNHKFYGHMDYFINTVTNTAGLGLTDLYASASFQAVPKKLKVALTAHNFTSTQESGNGESSFGQEVDLSVNYSVRPGTNIVWGGSVFAPGELMKAIFAPGREDTAFWSYLMIIANL